MTLLIVGIVGAVVFVLAIAAMLGMVPAGFVRNGGPARGEWKLRAEPPRYGSRKHRADPSRRAA